MMIQNLPDTAKAVLRGKFIAIHAYLKKQEKSQIKTLKELKKEKETKPKVNRRKDILKIRPQKMKQKQRKQQQRSIKLKAGSLRR